MSSGQIDFRSPNTRSTILKIAAPLLVAQIINLLYNIVDRIFIGMIPGEGTLGLAGLGLCFPLITMVSAFTNLFGAGGAPLFAIARGRQDVKRAASILANAYFMLLATGGVLMVLIMIFRRPILYLLGASDATYPYAAAYIMIYLCGTLFVMTSLGLNPYINSQGFAMVGMKTTLLGACVNLLLDPLFIFVLKLGVRGAALATIIAQFVSAIWVLRFLTGETSEIRLSFRSFRPDLPLILQITALGAAGFTMSFTNSLCQFACNSMLQTFGGDLYISVMTILNSIRDITTTPIDALSSGSSPVISFHYGAGNMKYLKKATGFLTRTAFICTLVIWLLLTLFPTFFIQIFSRDPEIVTAAVPSMHLYFFGYVFMAFQFAGQNIFKSLNKPAHAVFFSIFRKVIIVVPLTFILPHLFSLGVKGVFLAEPISNVIGGLACYITLYITTLSKLPDTDGVKEEL